MNFISLGRAQVHQQRLLAAQLSFENAGIEEARMEAEILLAAALGIEWKELLAGEAPECTPAQDEVFRAWLMRRLDGEPIAYLEGRKGFYGLEFQVDSSVLIPRADSECMVDAVLDFLEPSSSNWVADLGTGSGCLLLSTLFNRPNLKGLAVDLSPGAIQLARQNATHLGLSNRTFFVRGSWLDGIAANSLHAILCNPPYVVPGECLGPSVEDFVPPLALFTPHGDPYFEYRSVLARAKTTLKPEGRLFLEVGDKRAHDVAQLGQGTGFRLIRIVKDLGGVERLIELERSK